MKRSLHCVWLLNGISAVLFLLPAAAWAHHCSSLSDCLSTIEAEARTGVAIGLVGFGAAWFGTRKNARSNETPSDRFSSQDIIAQAPPEISSPTQASTPAPDIPIMVPTIPQSPAETAPPTPKRATTPSLGPILTPNLTPSRQGASETPVQPPTPTRAAPPPFNPKVAPNVTPPPQMPPDVSPQAPQPTRAGPAPFEPKVTPNVIPPLQAPPRPTTATPATTPSGPQEESESGAQFNRETGRFEIGDKQVHGNLGADQPGGGASYPAPKMVPKPPAPTAPLGSTVGHGEHAGYGFDIQIGDAIKPGWVSGPLLPGPQGQPYTSFGGYLVRTWTPEELGLLKITQLYVNNRRVPLPKEGILIELSK
jgi:hypothetical protein